MKYGVQISENDDGDIGVTQLRKNQGEKEFTSLGTTIFVDKGGVNTKKNLLDAIEKGLHGKITKTCRVK